MKPSRRFTIQLSALCVVLACALSTLVIGQDTQPATDKKKSDPATPGAAATPEAPTPAKAGPAPAAPPAASPAGATNQDASAKTSDQGASPDEIQLSLQGANIDMVVQWLAQTTGKTVIKHPRVQCQLTITSSKKLTKREAITLVYRALSLEGFTATESSDAILITPEGQEPKMTPELIDANNKKIPEGRQRLVKIFTLQHMQAAEMREKLRGVLSEKGSIETDDRVNQLIVTDYNENLKLMSELIAEFDVTDSDAAIQIFPLKYADADEVSNLIGLILNVTAPGGGSNKGASGSNSGGGGSPPPPGMPGMVGGPSQPSGGGNSPAGGIGGAVSAPQVRLWPDRTSNRLIVSAPKSKLAEVQRLLDILDTDQPEDVSVRSIALKNVAATDLVRELSPIYQKIGGKSRKDSIEIGANDRSNSLIVLSSEANFRALEKLVASLDTEDAQEKVVQTFILKNADAQDAAKQLQDLSKDQDSSRYPYYYFYSSSGSSDRNRKKMSVVADRRRNALVVQAPPAQMAGIEKMVQELDEPITDDSLAPKIFHLKYVSAVDIEDVLNELFLKKTQQRPYFYYFDEEMPEQTDRDVGRLYGKVRITSEPYSNTIIVTSNSKENLAVVEEVLKQLDSPSEAGESTLRIGLRFAKASTVANSINILFAKNGSPPLRPAPQQAQQGPQQQQQQDQQQQQSDTYQPGFDLQEETKEEGYYPWLGGQPDNPRSSDGRTAIRPVSDLVGRVRAVPDQRSNALLVSANVHYFPQVLKLLEELDAPTDQVLIEARLVEVSADFLDALGVRWSPSGSQIFAGDDYDNSFITSGQGTYQKGFGGNTIVNSPPQNSSGVLQSLTSLRSGVLDSTISMDFLVQFLRRTTKAKVLAEPQINIRDNETGRLFVGQEVPVPLYSQVLAIGGQSTSFRYKNVGVVLEVTPHINSSGDVELRIHAESSTVVPGQTILGGSIFDTRNFRTDLTAKNGQTLVLGGIIQKQVSDTVRKTPILGDIPGLGWAFKKKDTTTHDVELMVFMRPKVTRTPEETRDLLEDIYRKSPSLRQWDKESQQPANADKRMK